MPRLTQQATDSPGTETSRHSDSAAVQAVRIKSEELFQQQREVEIDHQGRIYRLRLTQLNKLILTA